MKHNTTQIKNYNELVSRLKSAKSDVILYEEQIKNDLSVIYTSLHPVHIIKETVHDLANDEDFIDNCYHAIGNISSKYIFDKILNKQTSWKNYLTLFALKEFIVPILSKNKEKIFSFITQILSKPNVE